MNTIKYIGMDLHSATISVAVVNDAGKLSLEATIATEASAVLDFVGGLQGTLYVAFEEGIQAPWLYDLLLPHVAQVVVCDPRQLSATGERTRTTGSTRSSWPNGSGWAF